MAKVHIKHPNDGDPVDPGFNAFGDVQPDGSDYGAVTGKLLDYPVAGQTHDGKTIEDTHTPSHWTVAFQNVDVPGNYTLEVDAVGADPDTKQVTVPPPPPPPAAGAAAAPPQISCSYPHNGDPVPSSFAANGASGFPYHVTGLLVADFMVKVGNNEAIYPTYAGVTVQGPPDSSEWTIEFSGIPPTQDTQTYQLIIVDERGSGQNSTTPPTTVDNLTIVP